MSETISTRQRRLAGPSISVGRNWQSSFESVADNDDPGGKPRPKCESRTWPRAELISALRSHAPKCRDFDNEQWPLLPRFNAFLVVLAAKARRAWRPWEPRAREASADQPLSR